MNYARRNLYLVGFMGTGKTTIGRELAKVMGRKFLDTDHVLEERFGKSVNEVFQQEGEAAFRAAEQALALELAASNNKVIATGGGTVIDPVCFESFQNSGLMLCLYTHEGSLLSRLHRTAKRPLLLGSSPTEVTDKITNLLREREAVYAKVHLRLDTTDLTPLTAARKVHDFLRSRPELYYEIPDVPIELR